MTEEQIDALLSGIYDRNQRVYTKTKELLKSDPNNANLIAMAKVILPYTDVSLHFSLKSTSMEQVYEKLGKYMLSGGLEITSEDSVIHHCFLTRAEVEEKGFGTEVVEFFESMDGEQDVVCYSRGLEGVELARQEMFEAMEKGFKPLCIFVGDIIDGVETEYQIAKDLGIQTIEL